jgi:N-acetylglutamate synthase-like GNAT family acetyltransferase
MNIAARANIRPAAAHDFPALSELAFRSKSHWGYDAAFMAACRDDLTITAVDAVDELVYVLERGGALIGFYALRPLGDTAELTNLFVEPKAIGHGYGEQLWAHAVTTAYSHQIKRILIESDPHAEAFYRAMGAVRIGDVASSVIPGRTIPLLHYDVAPTRD